MRNFINIVEAPLADITTHGEPLDKPGSFSEPDRRYMERSIVKGIYKKSFKKVAFDLYIYVLNHEALKKLGTEYPENEINKEFLDDLSVRRPEAHPVIVKLLKIVKVNQKKDPAAIHFILGDNFSDKNPIVPTPWILIHRLMHAWIIALNGTRNPIYLVTPVLDKYNIVARGYDIFTFKSAMTNTIESIMEFDAELFTQYILTGDIPLRNLDKYPPEARIEINDAITAFKSSLDFLIQVNKGRIFYI